MKKSCFVDWESLRFECSRRHKLRNEDDVLAFRQVNFPMVLEANDVGMLESFEHLGLFSEPLPLPFVQFLLLCKQKMFLFMEAEWELIGCQSRTDVIIRSSRHGATGAFRRELDCRNTWRQKSPPHGDLRKKSLAILSKIAAQRNAIE